MQITNLNTSWPRPLLFLRGMIRFIVLLLAFIYITLNLVSVASRNDTFRQWASSALSKAVSNQINATLEVEDIYIDPAKGLVIENIALFNGKDSLVTAKEISLLPQLWALLDNKLIIEDIILVGPNINLNCIAGNEQWNYELYFPSSEDKEPDTDSSTTKMTFNIKKLGIYDARFSYYDDNITPVSGKFNPGNLRFRDLDLAMSLDVKPAQGIYNIDIAGLSAFEEISGINIDHIGLEVDIKDNNITLNDLSVGFGSSEIEGIVRLGNIDINSPSLQDSIAGTDLELQFDNIKLFTDDIQKFLPVEVLGQEDIYINLDLGGKLGSPEIRNISIDFISSHLAISGQAVNIMDTTKLEYYVDLSTTNVFARDLKALTDAAISTQIPDFGRLRLPRMKIKGNLSNAKIDMKTIAPFGNIELIADVDYRTFSKYKGELKLSSFNPAALTASPNMKGDINAKVSFSGYGIAPDTLSGDLALDMEYSRFAGYNLKSMHIDAKAMGRGKFSLESLNINLCGNIPDSARHRAKSLGEIIADAEIDLGGRQPKYKLNVDLTDIKMAKLLRNNMLPSDYTGSLSLSGEGDNPDKISGDMQLSTLTCMFSDIALFPFDIALMIKSWPDDRRIISLKSDMMDMTAEGRFTIDQITNYIDANAGALGKYFSEISSAYQIADTAQATSIEINKKAVGRKKRLEKDVNIQLSGILKNLYLISPFIKDYDIGAKAGFGANLSLTDSTSRFSLDSLHLHSGFIFSNDLSANLMPATISSNVAFSRTDSSLDIQELDINISMDKGSRINDMNIDSLELNAGLKPGHNVFSARGGVLGLLSINADGELISDMPSLAARFTDFDLVYKDKLKWSCPDSVYMEVNPDNVVIKNFALQRDSAESIRISGSYDWEQLHNVRINLSEYSIADLPSFMPEAPSEKMILPEGRIDNLLIKADGRLSNPLLQARLLIDDLSFMGSKPSKLQMNLMHSDSLIIGFVKLMSPDEKYKLLNVNIRALPFNLAFQDIKDRFVKGQETNIVLSTDNFPLQILSPFVPAVKSLTGYADINLNIGGELPEAPEYSGKIDLKKSGFILTPVNMYFKARGQLSVETDMVSIDKFELLNSGDEMFNGKATVSGDIELQDYMPSRFDVSLTAKGLQVMSRATMQSLPTVYGPFVISTGKSPLRFHGTMETPTFDGDLTIDFANLDMPPNEFKAISKSVFTYKVKGNNVKIDMVEDSLQTENENRQTAEKPSTSFPDLIEYDMRINIPNRFRVTMALSMFGQQLVAEIGSGDKNQPLRYVKRRYKDQPELYGSLVLKEGSSLNFIKTFKTTGSISFPTGALDNPGLDLQAVNNWQTVSNNVAKDYSVKLGITGTKNRPYINFSYTIDNAEASGDSAQIREDAVFLLLLGKTKTEMMGQTDVDFSNIGASVIESSASSLMSNLLTSAFQGSSIIESADINFAGEDGAFDINQAQVSFSGHLAGGGKWSLGGTVADFSANNEFSIEYPLGLSITENTQIVFQLTRSINTVNISPDQKEWEIKFKVGQSW